MRNETDRPSDSQKNSERERGKQKPSEIKKKIKNVQNYLRPMISLVYAQNHTGFVTR